MTVIPGAKNFMTAMFRTADSVAVVKFVKLLLYFSAAVVESSATVVYPRFDQTCEGGSG